MNPNDHILHEQHGHTAVVTINRPDAYNAMNRDVITQLSTTLDAIEDSDATAMILTGAGKSFVAGADIGELATRTPLEGLNPLLQRTLDRLAAFPIPTIAAINGYAFGGGAELALACDIRVGSTDAQFALPETGIGIIPAAGATQRMVNIVGLGLATDMILTGRRLDSEEALAAGLITYRVAPEELLPTAHKVAERIQCKGPIAIQLAREVLRHGHKSDHATGMLLERLAQSILYATEDKHEGTTAFTEKRNPEFNGR